MPKPELRAARGDSPAAATDDSTISIASIAVATDHPPLGDCAGKLGWKAGGEPCPRPEWTPKRAAPTSVTLGSPIRLRVAAAAPSEALATLRGSGPQGTILTPRQGDASSIELVSDRAITRTMQKLALTVRWEAEDADVSPATTTTPVYVTVGRPLDDRRRDWAEDGVTLRRMERAMSWIAPLQTLDPHVIVSRLMKRFPVYTLHPSPKVPKRFRHPTYYNQEGGAWAMTDYVQESGECQAIVRLFRAMLRQLGVSARVSVIVVWADPRVEGGAKALWANLEKKPFAGLDAVDDIGGRQMYAALVDGPVEEGKSYPPSHTDMGRGRISPGLNRYEACLELTAGGRTRYYCGGAGETESPKDVLEAFWGLIWFTSLPDSGYRVEKIVRRYGGVS
jgi:hypothetical protein